MFSNLRMMHQCPINNIKYFATIPKVSTKALDNADKMINTMSHYRYNNYKQSLDKVSNLKTKINQCKLDLQKNKINLADYKQKLAEEELTLRELMTQYYYL
jgi:hypothetical protein